ncbi:MAG: glucose PTS transporter subunit IIA [Pseudobdellovibrionaceae bacterium]
MEKSLKNSFISVLQSVGQSLMIPVSVLPAAGLLVAVGRMLQKMNETQQSKALGVIADVAFNGGLAIFQQLPVVFAVGVAIGFTGGAGIAGLAAVVGYFTLANVLKVMSTALELKLAIDTGVFGGILIGLVVAMLYSRFQNIKLHPVLGFFSGKRFVPIISAATAIVLGFALSVLWPPIQGEINHFGAWVMGSDWGPAFYAAGKRLLIPLGLHHVYYPPFLYQFGEFVTSTGEVVRGETARFFAGDPSAGKFMAAEFPLMLFGLPAAAMAMVLRAEKSKRKAVFGVMLAAALTSIITGITEPIEFAFIFVAPLLFVFHVLAAFLSGVLTNAFDIHLGYTFSASLIDFGLGFFNQKNSMWLILVVGPFISLLYFSVFYFAIPLFNFKTPGRETDADAGPVASNAKGSEKSKEILAALGGAPNIVTIDACITRLRLQLKDSKLVQNDKLKQLGASGVLNAGGGNVQVVFGVESDTIKDEIKKWMSQESSSNIIYSPIDGKVLNLSEVPDETLAQKILGDGFAIVPSNGEVVSPVEGTIEQVFHTSHAVGIKTKEGTEILIHVGIDTVKMQGEGFKSWVQEGDQVKIGQKLLQFDLALVSQKAKSVITPIVITNSEGRKIQNIAKAAHVKKGDAILSCEMNS